MSREQVWQQMAKEYPAFVQEFDRFDNHEAIREIILGGAPAWAGVHARFRPFPGAKVLDIGSNVGVYALFCAIHGAHVTAVDPHPIFSYDLDALAKEYKLPINVVHKAIGAKSGYDLFRVHAKNGSMQTDGVKWSPADAQRSIKVEVLSLEEVLGSQEWDMVKVDIEGSEFEIFPEAAPCALHLIKFMFIEFHPWATDKIYAKTIELLQNNFNFEGTSIGHHGRWDGAYCTRR